MGQKNIFLMEIHQGFQIFHQKIKNNIFWLFDLVTFSMTLNSQKVYLQILLKIFLVKAKIVFYNIAKNLSGLFSCSLTIVIFICTNCIN